MTMFRRRRSPPISEALAYARCYGGRGGQIIDIAKVHPRARPLTLSVTGETLQQAFETKLAMRTRPGHLPNG
jgi:hypothetical protein